MAFARVGVMAAERVALPGDRETGWRHRDRRGGSPSFMTMDSSAPSSRGLDDCSLREIRGGSDTSEPHNQGR